MNHNHWGTFELFSPLHHLLAGHIPSPHLPFTHLPTTSWRDIPPAIPFISQGHFSGFLSVLAVRYRSTSSLIQHPSFIHQVFFSGRVSSVFIFPPPVPSPSVIHQIPIPILLLSYDIFSVPDSVHSPSSSSPSIT